MTRLVIVFTFCQLSFVYYTNNSESYGIRNGQLLFAVKYTFYSWPGQSKALWRGVGGGENANKHRKDIEPTHRECIAYITRSIVVIQWIAIKSHVIDATNKIFSFIVPAAGQSRRVESPDKYSCGIQNKKRVFCTKKP